MPKFQTLRPILAGLALAMAGSVALAQSGSDTPAAASGAADAASRPALQTLKEKNSYATGVMTARNLMRNDVPFDLDLIIEGLRDGIAKGPIRLSEKELKIVLQSMQAEMQRHLANERQVKLNLNRERGNLFQAEYRKKDGVVPLPGGLLYRVIKSGNGDRPIDTNTVVVRYRGTLVDGTEFDGTPEGKTATIALNEVIPGWRESLKRMNAGSTWEIVVPPTLAYGIRGAGDAIGPNETLVFTLELVAIVK